MMKKLAMSIITVIVILTTAFVVFAQSYLDDDSRYVSCPVGMGFVSYIDTASVAVQEYRPPEYVITINTIKKHYQDTNANHLRFYTLKFKYDYVQRKMYIYSPDGSGYKERYLQDRRDNKKPIDNSIKWNSEWQYIAPDVYYGEGTADIAIAGEVAFAIAYNLKFHGEKYRTFQEGFYAKLPNATKIKNNL